MIMFSPKYLSAKVNKTCYIQNFIKEHIFKDLSDFSRSMLFYYISVNSAIYAQNQVIQ